MSFRRFHHLDFADAECLVRAKGSASISVCIPTLNEAASIGDIVSTIRRELIETVPLVDEVLVVDSGSSDATLAIAAQAGATALPAAEISPHLGHHTGKGENLWKALHVAKGDLICYLDGDIANFHAGFVTGLVGPLLADPALSYVKAYYERPLADGDGALTSGGGRVSEILVRPLLSLFYPELSGLFQPLAGEYAARRELLHRLPFPTGYGVEIAHLIDLSAAGLLPAVAQTDLVKRIHRNRDDGELGRMAFALLRVILKRLHRDGRLSLHSDLPERFQSWSFDHDPPREILASIPEPERPPLSRSLIVDG